MTRRAFLQAVACGGAAIPTMLTTLPPALAPEVFSAAGVVRNAHRRVRRVVVAESRTRIESCRFTFPWNAKWLVEFPPTVSGATIRDSAFLVDEPPLWARVLRLRSRAGGIKLQREIPCAS